MILASLPFRFLQQERLVGSERCSILVAICADVIAIILFFKVIDMVRNDIQKLATVEVAQFMGVFFAAIGELVLLQSSTSAILYWPGMSMILLGVFYLTKMKNDTQARY